MADQKSPIMVPRSSPTTLPYANDRRTTTHKPAPSPLQLTQIQTPTKETFDSRSNATDNSPSSRGGSPLDSPRSSHASPTFPSDDQPTQGIQQEALDDTSSENKTPRASQLRSFSHSGPYTMAKESAFPPSRNVSTPVSFSSAATDSPPQSPSEIANTKTRAINGQTYLNMRTSSIDSTLSSVSSTTSHSHAPSPQSPEASEVTLAISAAGSAESAIRQLLKEKKHAAAESGKLWRLVNKQHKLLMGLNKDLERALHEKDGYRLRLRDVLAHTVIQPISPPETLRKPSTPRGVSPAPSESPEGLPIQRHSASEPAKGMPTELASSAHHPALDLRTSTAVPSPGSQGTTSASRTSFSSTQDMPTSLALSSQNASSQISPRSVDVSPTSLSPSYLQRQRGLSPDRDQHTAKASFTARRLDSISITRNSPTASSPLTSGLLTEQMPPSTASPLRKMPPAPLDLGRSSPVPALVARSHPLTIAREVDSDNEECSEASKRVALERRGRKMTREEDDSEREMTRLKELESRSQSKRESRSKATIMAPSTSAPSTSSVSPTSLAHPPLTSPSIRAYAPTDNAGSSPVKPHFSPPVSLADVLSRPSSGISVPERNSNLTVGPASPGLPRSPRPSDRPTLSPPVRPLDRSNYAPSVAAPSMAGSLSPRSPRFPPPPPPIQFSTLPALPPSQPETPALMSSPQSSPRFAGAESESSSRPPRVVDDNYDQRVVNGEAKLEQSGSLSGQRLQGGHLPCQAASSQPSSKGRQTDVESAPEPTPGRRRAISGPSGDDDILESASHAHPFLAQNTSDGIFRGFMSDAFPDLLLTPPALARIVIKVNSSRLKPSRYSTINVKSAGEEDQVLTLSIVARSDMQALWQVEKPLLSLPELDGSLKRASSFATSLPDRSLFSGHAPAKMDARRATLEKYFDDVLETTMSEDAAIIVCRYLSTQVLPVEERDSITATKAAPASNQVSLGSDGRIVKEGYLTKKGKNFGGWKSRFFALDEPVLRYYDSPGGNLLGTIRLHAAQIGRQSAQHSPSRVAEDSENPFRHAFVILEPKRKDSSSLVKHILCAESDGERDEWVTALLQYVSMPAPDDSRRPSTARNDASVPSKMSLLQSMMKGSKDDSAIDTGDADMRDRLHTVGYDDTIAGRAPLTKDRSPVDMPSPILSTHNVNQTSIGHNSKISKPKNGSVIHDVGAWGNRPPESPRLKEPKKRSMWGFREGLNNFRDKTGHDVALQPTNDLSTGSARPPRGGSSNNNGIRPAFGIPLQEAVQYCQSRDSNVLLPAVVYRCLQYLEAKDAINEEGLFRLSGSSAVIKGLREQFDRDGDLDFLADPNAYYDVHAVASLLKLYLRELPQPVLTRELHMELLQVLDIENKVQKIAAYNRIVHRLPLVNWTLVRTLSVFLIGLINNCAVNKMSIRNVGIVFSPTLNIPAPIFAAFLTEFEAIFETDPPADDPPSIDIIAPSPQTTHDTRSARTQIFSGIPTPSYNQADFLPSGLGLSYDPPRDDFAAGFIPLRPTYEPAHAAAPSRARKLSPSHASRSRSSSRLSTLDTPSHGSANTVAAPRHASPRRNMTPPNPREPYATALPSTSSPHSRAESPHHNLMQRQQRSRSPHSGASSREVQRSESPHYRVNLAQEPMNPSSGGMRPAQRQDQYQSYHQQEQQLQQLYQHQQEQQLLRQQNRMSTVVAAPPGVGLGSTGIMRDKRARRESSMLLTSKALGGNRLSSMPVLRDGTLLFEGVEAP